MTEQTTAAAEGLEVAIRDALHRAQVLTRYLCEAHAPRAIQATAEDLTMDLVLAHAQLS